MDSTSNRVLETKEEKKQAPIFDHQMLSIFDSFSVPWQRLILSFLFGDDIEKQKNRNKFNTVNSGSFFFECKASLLVSEATKVIHNLAHRIEVNKTLEFLQENPYILQSLPFPLEIKDRCGRTIKRTSIIGALVALDELEAIKLWPQYPDKTYSLISTLFFLFEKTDDLRSCHIKQQLQQQLKEASGPHHELATKKRRSRYLNEIEIFINKVIECADILNDSHVPLENLLNLKFIQDFIKNAFKPDPQDNGEEGIVWDLWQLILDYHKLLVTYISNDKFKDKSRPKLGSFWSKKTDVIDIAVWLAFLRCSQFYHLEISAKGIGNALVGEFYIGKPPIFFDCSKGQPDILIGIGDSHFFDLFGEKLTPGARGHFVRHVLYSWWSEAEGLLSYKNSNISLLMQTQPPYTKNWCRIM